jgi:hypothetical protein
MRSMAKLALALRAAANRPEVYDVRYGQRVVGMIMLSDGSTASQWAWTVAHGYQKNRKPTHGYEPTREAAMQAFARSWHRET